MRINGGRAEVRPLSLTIALVLSFALAIAAHGLLPRTASAESGTFRIYFVQTGDSLSEIAAQSAVSLDVLIDLNQIDNPNHLVPGAALVIAASSGPAYGSQPPVTTTFRTYRVEPGDTLSAIAARHDVDGDVVMRMNNLQDADVIRIGTLLNVPAPPPVAAPQIVVHHVVLPGDSASGIAEQYGVSLLALSRANQLSDIDRIHPGTLLAIPARSLPAPPTNVQVAVQHAAADYGLDPYLLLALAYLESGWQMDVVSPAGAVGMMQLMPDTARWAVSDLFLAAANWPHSLTDNTRVGAAYFRHLIAFLDGDVAAALAAYYQGWASAEADGLFDDTRQYVDDVLALRERFRAMAPLF